MQNWHWATGKKELTCDQWFRKDTEYINPLLYEYSIILTLFSRLGINQMTLNQKWPKWYVSLVARIKSRPRRPRFTFLDFGCMSFTICPSLFYPHQQRHKNNSNEFRLSGCFKLCKKKMLSNQMNNWRADTISWGVEMNRDGCWINALCIIDAHFSLNISCILHMSTWYDLSWLILISLIFLCLHSEISGKLCGGAVIQDVMLFKWGNQLGLLPLLHYLLAWHTYVRHCEIVFYLGNIER